MSNRRSLFLATIALMISQAVGQVPELAGRSDGRRMFYEHIQIVRLDAADRILYLAGDVRVQIDDMIIRCDNLVAWLAERPADEAPRKGDRATILPPKESDRLQQASQSVREIYAEGTVVFSQREEWVRADRIFLDLVNHRGIMVDARLSAPLPGTKEDHSIIVHADELRLLARDRMQATGVRMTTCAFGHPHYHVSSSVIDVVKDRAGVIEPSDPSGLRENYHIEASGNVLHVGTVPVFWVPNFVGDTARRRTFDYIEDVRFNRSNRFGYEFGITLGDDIEDAKGVFGHWSVPISYYSKRGFGSGVDFVYGDKGREFEGDVSLRYQRDHGQDRFFGEPPTENRGRVSFAHRHRLPWEVQLDAELQIFSDRGYYPTWFEDEDKGEKPPENLIYLKRAFANSYVTALYTMRLNDWETVAEYQPEVRYDLVYQPLFDLFDSPVYLNTTVRGSKNRLEVDEDLNITPRGTWRFDLDALLEYPFDIGPMRLTPFVGPRYTWYEEDIFERRSEDRFGITSGATLAFQAWRLYDVHGGIFGLDGMRHVVSPSLTFRNISGVKLHPDELVIVDDVDTFDNFQVFEFEVRNLFQTVRQRESGPVVEEFVDLETEIDYYPNAGRDFGGDPWSNLRNDLIVRFSDDFQLAFDSELNFYGRGMEIANVALGFTPSREFQAYAGFRHFHDTYDAVFFQTNWRIEEKWMVTGETSYDFEEDRGLEHRLVVTRFAHDWVLQFGLKADVGENDFGVTISLEPRILFDPVRRRKGVGAEPRLLYLGSGLSN